MAEDMLTATGAPVSQEIIEQHKLVVMYKQLPNVLIFTFVATSALALYFYDHLQNSSIFLWGWWGAMQLVSGLRLANLVWWRKYAVQPVQNPQLHIWLFGLGSLAAGVLWACFSIHYFYSATISQRLVISLVMSTIAAGSVNVLALIPQISRILLVLLIGPLVVMFSLLGGIDDLVVAGLGIILFIGLTGFSRVSNDSFLGSLMALQDSNRKIAGVFAQRDELIQVKSDLEARVSRKVNALQNETALKERYALELDKIANSDSLTGLLNRTSFDSRLRELLNDARTRQKVVGMMAIEVLNFDVIELQGALVSDQVLLAIADRLRAFMPSHALIACWGGAEFFVATGHSDTEAGTDQFWSNHAALVHNVLQKPIATDGGAICADALIGVTRYPDLAINSELMFYQSAAAKHGLRKLGVGGVKVFNPVLDSSLKERHRLGQALHHAIEASLLNLVFQPLVPASTSLPYKMEALLRWQDAEFGQVSPVTFIPIAEERGLIVPLGRWVLLSACRAATTWQGNCVVCVNVSIHQILAGDLLRDIELALQHSGLAANRLEIEITESMFAQDMNYICSVLESVRALGVSIAIDDFGTGYSSLAYLRRLPVHTIKIDRSFITEVDDDARKLLFSIVTMARGLGFQIVAEGVETIQQEDLLLALGVDYLQGFLLSKPLPLANAQTWLRTLPSRYKE